jgi:hypothetical protein
MPFFLHAANVFFCMPPMPMFLLHAANANVLISCHFFNFLPVFYCAGEFS